MGAGHYENFPVASWLLPAPLRPAVRAIYRFARTADDIADEGDEPPDVRLARLAALRGELDAIARNAPNDWPDLDRVIRAHGLPMQPFHDLLSAFSQDVTTHRYQSFEALQDYCRRSADPIGRLLLALHRRDETRLHSLSDAICTGLQLTNFWQDIAADWRKGRVYLPQEDLHRCGVDESWIADERVDERWRALVRFELSRARRLLHTGYPLAAALGGRVGVELRCVMHGGLRIVERIDAVGCDVFRRRPRLAAFDWAIIGWRALRPARQVGVETADTLR
jgi:squalene synthase HpnC